MNSSDTSQKEADRQAAEGPNLKPNEVAPDVSREEFEARHPDDPANAPGWGDHVKEFFDREVFPGEKIRKATDAMKDEQIEDESP